MEQTDVDRRGNLLSPEGCRSAVVVLQGRYRASERRVCRVVGQHRSIQRPNGKVVPIEATAYAATHIDESLLPFTCYGALVIAGAVEHGLPMALAAHR